MDEDNTTERWRRVKQLFQEALMKPVAQQQAFLENAAGDDESLLSEVRQLLDAAQHTGEHLEDMVAEAAAEASDTPSISEFIQQYRIVNLLGEGGMGQVYLAERADEQYRQQVAIKVLGVRRPTEEIVQRFRAERQMLATLDHPNIARLLDGGETDDGAPFLVMEYVDGESIDSYCDARALSTRERLALFTKVCGAVDHAHRNLIIHRDIKPSNILVGDNNEPKLLDFGIAKLLEPDADVVETRSSSRLMSPLHASPEQVRGETITVATDIYSLGVLLYQMLTGQHPYKTGTSTPAEVERAICEMDPEKPSSRVTRSSDVADSDLQRIASARGTNLGELSRTIGGDLDNIVLMALNKEPERRYASVREFVADIQRFLDYRPVNARPNSLSYRTGKFLRRNRLPSAIAAAAIVTVVAAVGISVDRIANERDIANAERQKAEVVSTFLQDVFFGASPEIAQGEDTTARELLEYGAKQIDNNLTEQPAVRAAMLRVLGEVFYNLSNLDRAEELLKQALITIEREAEPSLDELATIKLLLAFIEQGRSNYDTAQTMFAEVRSLREQHFGADSFEVVEAISAQAHLIEFQGRLPEAQMRFEEALAVARRLTRGDHTHTAEIQSKLAAVHRQQGHNDEAEALLQSALAMQQRLYDPVDPKISETKRYLADLYRDQRRFEESEALYLDVINTRTKVLGANHIEVGITYNEYGILLSDKGDTDGAVAAAKEFVRVLDVNYDAPTSEYGAAYNNLAWLQEDQEDYDGALASFRKSIDVQDAIGLPDDHLHRSFPLYGMAVVYLLKKDYSAAEQMFRRVLPMRRQHFDESHLYVSQVKNGLGGSLIGLKKLDEAKKLIDDTLVHLREQQGDDHPETRQAVERLEIISSVR